MRLVPVLGAAALALALSGCSLLGFGADEQQPMPKSTQTTQVAEVDKVIKALEPLTGAEDSVPSTKKFFTTMLDAGYEAEQLEATIDESPLGNDVPSKMFGVKTDKGCVVGEIRKGKVTAELMQPTESTGSCLLGAVERPKGVEAPEGEKRDEDGDSNGAGHLPGENINGEDEPTESPSSTEGDSSAESASSAAEADSTADAGSSTSDSAEGDASGEAPSLGGG